MNCPYSLALMIERMPTHAGMHATEVVALQIRKIEVLQVRAAERAVGGKIQLLPFRVVNQQTPLTSGIDLDDLMDRGHVDALMGDPLEGV